MSRNPAENLYKRGASTTQQLLITRQLVMLQTASGKISSTLEEKEAYDTITSEFLNLFSSKACILSTWDNEKNLLNRLSINQAGMNGNEKQWKQELTLRKNSLRERVVKQKKVLQANTNDPNIDRKEQRFLKKLGFQTFLLLPLVYKNQVIGLIELYDHKSKQFEIHEIIIAKLLADHAGIAIENAKLFDRAQTELQIRQQIEDQLRHDALHDNLTSLPNRTLFNDRLERAIIRSKRFDQYTFAVIFMDLDNFKRINDTFGHAEGDYVLSQIADTLENSIREIDTISRFGGDEFLILLESEDQARGVITFAERVQRLLSAPMKVKESNVSVTASIGIVTSSPDYETPEEYIQNADIAMYHAKAKGKGRHSVFSATKGLKAKQRLTIEAELNQAISNKKFFLHYQPILDLKTMKLSGFESLIRWERKNGEIFQPDRFIPILEDTGLIVDVGGWVLETACTEIKTLQEKYPKEPPISVSVNVSGSQLRHPQFLAQVEQVIKEVGFNPNALVLEITESIFIEERETVKEILEDLNALGIKIHLDDFGTGFSSLSYLSTLPINALKIDREFTSKIDPELEHQGLLELIIALAQNIGIPAIAEGVEKPEQLTVLKKVNCDYVQGYYLQNALTIKAANTFLRKNKSLYT